MSLQNNLNLMKNGKFSLIPAYIQRMQQIGTELQRDLPY